MILNLEHFIEAERPYWDELEVFLERIARRTGDRLTLDETRRFYYLYRRAASGLARVNTFSAAQDMKEYLEALVAQAYAEIHETREQPLRFRPLYWFFVTFPRTFRKHATAFLISLALLLAGSFFGAGAILVDENAKTALLPFSHLMGSPSDRVAQEESAEEDRLQGRKSTFAAQLMANNIRVSIMAMAFGITFGLGTMIMMFYNGAILGAVALDYMMAGESVFLVGWLLPHGSVEIPSILFAGQAGLVLGHALIGWGTSDTLRERFRKITPDLVMLIYGVAVLLIWAGIVESFFSQYHEPAIPYWLKISFGTLQLILLCAFLMFSGKRHKEDKTTPASYAQEGKTP